MAEVTFEVPLPWHGCEQNTRKHWRVIAKAVAGYKQEVSEHALVAFHNAKWEMPPHVTISFLFGTKRAGYKDNRYRPRDEQNAIGAMKAAVDGMVKVGMVVDDSANHLKIGDCSIDRKVGPWVRVHVTTEPVALLPTQLGFAAKDDHR